MSNVLHIEQLVIIYSKKETYQDNTDNKWRTSLTQVGLLRGAIKIKSEDCNVI